MIAIAAKEWRRILRSGGTPWAIGVYLLLPVLIAAAYLKTLYGTQGVMSWVIPLLGGHVLAVVAVWQVILLAAAAPWLAAGLLAGEAEEGTLQLLIASGQRLIGIVTGKYLALLLFLGVMMLAGVPLFALPLLVGGVSWGLLGRVLLIEGATVAAMSGLGLLLSAFSRSSSRAALSGLALALVLTLGTGLLSQMQPVVSVDGKGEKMIQTLIQGPMGPAGNLRLSRWLYPNPAVGVNSAVGQTAVPGLFGFPGAGSLPVYKSYPLWKVQVAAGGALALLGLIGAWLAMAVRLHWRWPPWRRTQKPNLTGGAAPWPIP